MNLFCVALLTWTALCEQQASFSNPVVYEDFADNDVSVGPDGAFYFSASNMHYSPGAPILKSYDLASWELIGHSVPSLDFGDKYNMANGQQAYRGGTWASTMRYRKSSGLWYWIGCIDFWNTFIYTATNVTGPWTRAAQLPGGTCYYDCGLLIDDDDTMYVVYGATNVSVAQLAADGRSQVKTQNVFGASAVGEDGIEGNRMYKINGTYYILDDHPGDTTYIWKSSSPWGPYTSKILAKSVQSPVPNGGAPHQGSLVVTAKGDWYYMSFTWAYPAGRMPVLAPVTWGSDGFPTLVVDSQGGWGATYPMPLPSSPRPSWTGTDMFPDTSKFAVNNGLTLSTTTLTTDLYAARNTLTHRIHGEFPTGVVLINFGNMADGDRCGFAAFRDRSASIGVYRTGDTYTVSVVHNMTQDESTWSTTSNGTVVATDAITGKAKRIWLRASLDARASGTKAASFAYSLDGSTFKALGGSYTMYTNWAYFMGYRYAIFNYATKALGGSVKVEQFTSS
ncbi:glycosyl hydrolase family 43 protein [Thozetella sp. PMI_491]|nr:glycosyl hydrolase family 43 protein [Thozetella sp. PMI_491]